jgi:hypothetical protein
VPIMEYTLRQRLALVIEADTTAEKIVAMADGDIDHGFFLKHSISPTLLRAAAITPLQLKAHGTRTAAQLADLGFNTLHVMDDEWCDDAIAAYGAPALLDQFLNTTNDAVILAGTDAVERLGINLGLLLLICSEQPGPAREVLAQYKNARNVPPETLIETGLRAPDLVPLGFTEERLRADTLATDAQIALMGF